jgi:hypothetical protein
VGGDTDPAHLSNESLGVVVLVGADRLLVGTGQICSHRLGRIPFAGAHSLGDAAVDDQGMAVVHEHMAPIAGQCWMDLGFAGQQGIGIAAGPRWCRRPH